MTLQPAPSSSNTALVVLRVFLWITWVALLLAPVAFMLPITLILNSPSAATEPTPDPHGIWVLFYVSIAMSVCSISLFQAGKFIVLRKVLRRGSRTGLLVAYPICKILAWCACEGAIYFNLVICLIARSFLPSLPLAALIWLILALDLPLFLPFSGR